MVNFWFRRNQFFYNEILSRVSSFPLPLSLLPLPLNRPIKIPWYLNRWIVSRAFNRHIPYIAVRLRGTRGLYSNDSDTTDWSRSNRCRASRALPFSRTPTIFRSRIHKKWYKESERDKGRKRINPVQSHYLSTGSVRSREGIYPPWWI